MTQEEKRIKIAEACGKQIIYFRVRYDNHGMKDYYIAKTRDDAESYPFNDYGIEEFANLAVIPDYFNDLNAMHEAEEKIPEDKYEEWAGRLANICTPPTYTEAAFNDYWVRGFKVISSKAAQRAEAFGLTLGLWKEGE